MRACAPLLLALACARPAPVPEPKSPAIPHASATRDADALLLPAEHRHLSHLRQLTFGGENAEAYFSPDGTHLVFQSTRDGEQCDQIYVMDVDGGDVRRISRGGANTCGYFTPDGKRLIFATTFLDSPACPPKADRSKGYVWPLHRGFDIVSTDLDGSDLRRLTDSPGYDAEGTISRDGTIVFTSVRDGDLELYEMNADGSNQGRITRTPGYDGGAFFSPDGMKLVWRSSRPEGAAMEEYRQLLAEALVKPGRLEIVVGNADGTGAREITSNGAANFAPFFLPDGKRVIFSSNAADPKGGPMFDLFVVPVDGGPLEQVTFAPEFDGFPMFSPDGKQLVFASNRGGKVRGETNVFLADWTD